MVVMLAALAWAHDDAAVEVVVEADSLEGPDPARTHAAVTVVRTDTATGTDDVATALAAVPGAHVRRLGGLGELATVTVRGSAARQVAVFLDGIPLNPDGAGAVDLSELPLRSFDRLEVWRSGVPPSLGAGGVGGAVNLVTGSGAGGVLSVGGGAWGTGRVHGSAAGPVGDGDGFLAVDLLSTRGDFRYLDDGGTPYTVIDDRLTRRAGNDTGQITAHGRLRATTGPVRWTILNAALHRDEGVPGFSWAQRAGMRYRALRDLAALQADGDDGTAAWRARLWGWHRWESLDDRNGTSGLGRQHSADRSTALGAHTGVVVDPSPALTLDTAADLRREVWRGADLLADTLGDPRGRTVGSIGAAATGRLDAVAITPAARAVVLDPGDAPPLVAGLPALGLRADLAPVTVKANAARAFRPPDLFELYGDRGVTVGNPELRPERATRIDAGGLIRTGWIAAEAAVFASWLTDRIAWTRNGQGVARAENVARSSARGVEAGATVLAGGWLAWRTSLTHTVARDRDTGLWIPWIPAWSAWTEPSVRAGPVRLTPSASFAARSWRDAANFVRDPPRLFVGAAAGWTEGPWTVELDVRNLLDTIAAVAPADPLDASSPDAVRSVSDFQGFPLPGHTWMLTVELAP